MSTTRIYQNIPLQTHSSITLDEGASNHLGRVLRAQVGDKVTIFNGEGGEYSGEIEQISKKTVTVLLKEFLDRNPESSLNLILVQGISRGEKMDFTIQKATELGVTSIVPVLTERGNVKLASDRLEKKMQHWQAVAISAAEQSGRTRIPTVSPTISLDKWLKTAQPGIKVILSPHMTQGLKDINFQKDSPIYIVIGPEGGLSESEINQAISLGFQPLNLGPRILRTETAGLAAISIFQSHFGDMR